MLTAVEIRALRSAALPLALYEAGCAPRYVRQEPDHQCFRLNLITYAYTCWHPWEPHLRLDQAIMLLEPIQDAGWDWYLFWNRIQRYGKAIAALTPQYIETYWGNCDNASAGDTQAAALCRLRLLWEAKRQQGTV